MLCLAIWAKVQKVRAMSGLGLYSSQVRSHAVRWLLSQVVVPLGLVVAMGLATAAMIVLVVDSIRP